MDSKFEKTFEEVERLYYHCEVDNNLERAESMLKQLAESTKDPAVLAGVYGELAQAQFLRYEYAPEGERLAIAENGVKLARRGLEYDGGNLQANAWAAAMMGLHGLEMGILSSLFYIDQIKKCAERAVQLDEGYHSGMCHQILGDVYRISPPSPISIRDKRKALEHLLRARELGPACPQAKIRLAELYISMREKDLARKELHLVLDQEIEERGPRYAAICKEKARKIEKKLG